MICDFVTKPLNMLSDIQTGPFGSQLHKEDYVSVGTPIVTVEHLGRKRFAEQNLPLVSEEDKIRLSRYVLEEGDIVFSRVGSVDRCSFVSSDYAGWMFSGRCLRVRPLTDIYPLFLYYFFTLESTKQFVRGIATGATMPSINTKFMGEIPITYPPIAIQKRIAEILCSIDDKIEINEQINQNLEEQLLGYYRELFVKNTDPSWKTATISDLGKVVGGSTPSKKKDEYYTSDGIAWITPKDLSINHSKFIAHGEIDITELGLANSSAVRMPAGTVLFSSRAPIGYIAIADGVVTTNQGFKSVVPYDEIGTAFVYCFLKENLSVIENMASGSTFKEISGSTMKIVPAFIPDTNTMTVFRAIADAILEKQKNNEAENKRLSTIRDALLPKLMSGEINVSEIEL